MSSRQGETSTLWRGADVRGRAVSRQRVQSAVAHRMYLRSAPVSPPSHRSFLTGRGRPGHALNSCCFFPMALLLFGLFSQAPAAQFTVINTNDDGLGSLRQALIDANNNPSPDVIHFNLPGPGPPTTTPETHP